MLPYGDHADQRLFPLLSTESADEPRLDADHPVNGVLVPRLITVDHTQPHHALGHDPFLFRSTRERRREQGAQRRLWPPEFARDKRTSLEAGRCLQLCLFMKIVHQVNLKSKNWLSFLNLNIVSIRKIEMPETFYI